MLTTNPPYIHWNYFIALESDFEKVTRYIEMAEDNYKTYSIELAHLLLACSSEVDVVLKGICKRLQPTRSPGNINEYRDIIKSNMPQFSERKVTIPRYNLEITPWEKWVSNNPECNPDWWRAYNNVKHDRGNKFKEANLHNSIGAITGLFITVLYFYKNEAIDGSLGPNPKLLFPEESYSAGYTPTDFGIIIKYNL